MGAVFSHEKKRLSPFEFKNVNPRSTSKAGAVSGQAAPPKHPRGTQ